jgi:hypothetical protein
MLTKKGSGQNSYLNVFAQNYKKYYTKKVSSIFHSDTGFILLKFTFSFETLHLLSIHFVHTSIGALYIQVDIAFSNLIGLQLKMIILRDDIIFSRDFIPKDMFGKHQHTHKTYLFNLTSWFCPFKFILLTFFVIDSKFHTVFTYCF